MGGEYIARQDAKTSLEAEGVNFPPGSSVVYLPGPGKLVVRNTRANIDRIASLSGVPRAPRSHGISANATDELSVGRENEARVAGLLPIRLDLPANGRVYEFGGGGQPGALDFQFTDWRTAARLRWTWLTLGALGFLTLAAGWAHPWRRTLAVMLALTFFPLIVAPSSVGTCNALLAGWLWAVLGRGVTRFLLRRRPSARAVLLCLAAFAPTLAHAAPAPEPTPAPSPELVIVPYDATRPAAGQKPAQYYLPYERFLTLWDAAKRHRRPPVPEPPPGGERYTLSTARYDARLAGETLEIDATLDLQTSGDGWVAVPLRFEGTRVGSITLDGAPAALAGEGVLWVGTPGAHRINAALQLPAARVADGTRLQWTVPPTAATLVTLLLPSASRLRAEIRGNSPGGEVEEITPEGHRLTACAGCTPAVQINFHDAPPPAPAAKLPALAHIVAQLTAGARQETVQAEIDFAFAGGTQDTFHILLDPGLTLTGLDAPDIKQWHLAGGARQVLDVTLNTPAHDAYRVTLQADRRPATTLPEGRRTFPLVSAAARRVEQIDVLLANRAVDLALPAGLPPGVPRVAAPPADGGRPFAAFESDGFGEVVYTSHPATDKRAAHIDYLYQVGRGKIELAASVRLIPEPGGAPLLTADLRLPAGFTVQAVAGDAVRQWWRDGDLLSLRFRPEDAARAEIPLVVYLVRQFDRAPDRFALQPLVATGFAETDGQTVVAADRSLKIGLTLPTAARSHDLAEIDPATAAGEFQVKSPLERQRAFHYRGAEFDVTATLESQPPRWQAQWVTRATVREGVVAWETRVNVAARQGAVDALEFSLPSGLPEARVSGPEVRETVAATSNVPDRRAYRVIFQNPVYADHEAAFTVSLELPLAADGRAALPGLEFPGGDGSRTDGGFLLVETLPPAR